MFVTREVSLGFRIIAGLFKTAKKKHIFSFHPPEYLFFEFHSLVLIEMLLCYADVFRHIIQYFPFQLLHSSIAVCVDQEKNVSRCNVFISIAFGL